MRKVKAQRARAEQVWVGRGCEDEEEKEGSGYMGMC